MTDQPEKLDLGSLDIAEERREELLRLFPEIRTEGGKLDFERLKLALGDAVDVGRERYGMSWPGKADCFRTIQAPSLATLRPCPEESVNFGTSENLIIEGDNLEVLKLLQKSYLGKVKMIYIDPPYNTGNDFIYPDNYTESLQTYLQYTGQVGAEGKKFGTNTEADGRFHSKWLNMMYPRLYLAKNLLREDGVIFISIDDNEADNLRKLLSEIFGEENFVAEFVWVKKKKGSHLSDTRRSMTEYVLCYGRSAEILSLYGEPVYANKWQPLVKRTNSHKELTFPAGLVETTLPSGPYEPGARSEGGTAVTFLHSFSVVGGRVTEELRVRGPFVWGQEYLGAALSQGARVSLSSKFGFNVLKGDQAERFKTPSTLLDEDQSVGTNEDASAELEGLFSAERLLDYPKPVSLLRYLCDTNTHLSREGIILDFFAGSGTTAQAALELNRQDSGSRRFILVQLPEPTGREDYPTIVDICKERVRRVIKKLNEENAEKLDLGEGTKQDRGFRVFKLAESCFCPWDTGASRDAGELAEQLEMFVDHIRDGRTDQDLLFEILLKDGYPLTSPIEALALAGKTVHSVAGGLLLICLDRELTLELIRAMAERKPERVVCLDEGFAGNDQLKANAVQIFKTKGVTAFKTR